MKDLLTKKLLSALANSAPARATLCWITFVMKEGKLQLKQEGPQQLPKRLLPLVEPLFCRVTISFVQTSNKYEKILFWWVSKENSCFSHGLILDYLAIDSKIVLMNKERGVSRKGQVWIWTPLSDIDLLDFLASPRKEIKTVKLPSGEEREVCFFTNET